MEIIVHDTIIPEEFPGGATYQTLVGDTGGSTPVRCGIQTSPPGYATPNHAHPYVEIVTILQGTGEAWTDGDDETTALEPGMTMIVPPDTMHGFRVTGDCPLVTYGVHTSPERIVQIAD
ncbi:MAG: cupin domain-containing protein [Pseudomonadota bacterium]|nr:cupin domain-containing protein [Pseudomonadota bacterium]